MSTTPDTSQQPGADTSPAPNPPETARTEADVIQRLAGLPPMDYDRARKQQAQALGVQVKTLDEKVKGARSDASTGGRMPFVDHEPTQDAVDPAQLLDDVTAVILRFVVLDVEQAHAAALWVAHTHLTAAAEVSPLAILNAPERACAKTLLQTLLGRLVYRPLPASNASLSALFRAVEHWQPTILIDEADTFFRENAELHGMVNAGYKRGGYVLRSEATGDSFEPKLFSVYGAKSIAGIALERHLPDATMSRGIVFNMRRKLPHERVERMRNADDGLFDRLASRLVRFALDHEQQVGLARPQLPNELSDRAQDNWEPLLAIAACAGPLWLQRATDAALNMSAASDAVASTGNELLADIKEVFEAMAATRISTVDLLAKLTDDEEKSWAAYNRGKPMTPRQLAKQLEVYGIKSKTVRMGPKSTPKGYEHAQFEDAFRRYLKPPPEDQTPVAPPNAAVAETPQQPLRSAGGGPVDALLPPGRCAVADTSAEPGESDPSGGY